MDDRPLHLGTETKSSSKGFRSPEIKKGGEQYVLQNLCAPVNRARNLLEGLKAHEERIAKRGITPEILARMEELHGQASQNETRRNGLRAQSLEATTEQEQVMEELNAICTEARKLIRIEMSEDSWPAFGFRSGEFSKKKPKPADQPSETDQPES